MTAMSALFHRPPRLAAFLILGCFLGAGAIGAEPETNDSERSVKPGSVESSTTQLHRPLPESLTSFGACVVGEYLYVFSGHSGVAHGFGADLLVNHFRRIKFDDPAAEWEELAMHKPAQSVAIVTDGQYIYRVGGLSFLNSGGDSETNFNSTKHFARYDIEADAWTELAELPDARSSLDAAVVGRSIYVAGGWNLQGSASRDAPWHEDILRFDLDKPDSGWQSLEGPGYLTRAVSTAAFNGKFYLFGGIGQRGINRTVSVYDPKSDEWSEAPELPADSSTAGFATSSFAAGGKLYVTGSSGVLYRLSDDEKSWDVANRLMFPRMFLRLVPASDSRLLALGGTGSIGRTAVVESVDISVTPTQNIVQWSVPFEGRAKHSQSVVVSGAKLYAFGGNASRDAHDFSRDAFVDEAFMFDLGNQTVESLPAVPVALQSAAIARNSQTSEHNEFVLVGGLGPSDEGLQYLRSNYAFNPESKEWTTLEKQLPQSRAMFTTAVNDDAIWMFGGSAGREHGLADTVLHWWGDQTEIAPLHEVSIPNPRRSFGGATLDGKYYLVGGLGEGNAICESVDVFDFDTRQWSSIAPPATSRVFPSLAEAGGKLYLFGGFTSESGHFSPASSLECFNPESGKWTTVADSLDGIPPSMSMHEFSDRLLFYGIDAEQDGVANFAVLDPSPLIAPVPVSGMNFASSRGGDDSAETARMMIRRDTNKDGKLSADELGSRLASLVKTGDTDGDNLLTISETAAALKAQAEVDKAAELRSKLAEATQAAEAAAAKAQEAAKDAAEKAAEAASLAKELAEATSGDS
ncbi:MAG TPA: hypothetical protein DDW52_07835 [Planctomycetaceae bacterium]|nr:hypothetical protein [Planctomycetaceae bacterium]